MKFSSSRMFPGQCQLRELLHGRSRNRFDLLLHAAAVLLREVANQQRNVLGTLAQRRNADRKDVQPIIQVAAKLAILDHLFEIAIRGRHQAHIHLLGASAAQPLKLAFLQSAQQLGLNLEGNVANLVQKQ